MKSLEKEAKREEIRGKIEHRQKLFDKALAGDVKSLIRCEVFMGMADAEEVEEFLS
jgi:hypothetical protein